MSAIGRSGDSKGAVRDSRLDAVREVGLALVAGFVAGAAIFALTDLAMALRASVLAPLALFGFPILVFTGWVGLGIWRKVTRRVPGRWADLGVTIGIFAFLAALYGGIVAGAQLLGPPSS